MAVQRHVMNRREFDHVMRDARVAKYLAVDGDSDGIAGLATFTNELEAMPLISPEFFARRWPELHAEKRVWYLGFFAVDAAYRGGGTFEAVIAAMWREVQAGAGVAALDVCAFNAAIGLPAAIQRTLRAISPKVVTHRLTRKSIGHSKRPVTAQIGETGWKTSPFPQGRAVYRAG